MEPQNPGKEEVSKNVKDLDDWLPITKSRSAKWWYSAFHNVTAMVGAGVLGLPYAMSQLGWYVYFNYANYKWVLVSSTCKIKNSIDVLA